jgi:hypothetical protein
MQLLPDAEEWGSEHVGGVTVHSMCEPTVACVQPDAHTVQKEAVVATFEEEGVECGRSFLAADREPVLNPIGGRFVGFFEWVFAHRSVLLVPRPWPGAQS